MTTMGCDSARDLAPEWVRGALEPGAAREVAAHVAACDDCAAEANVVRALLGAPVDVPAGLHERIILAVGRPAAPWYRGHGRAVALAATAAGVLLLGRSVLDREPGDAAPGGAPVPVAEASGSVLGEALAPPYSGWPGADGVLAGSVVLQDLSDDELELLLQEMDS